MSFGCEVDEIPLRASHPTLGSELAPPSSRCGTAKAQRTQDSGIIYGIILAGVAFETGKMIMVMI